MDDIRKGQIAYLFVKKHLREKGVRLAPALHREIGSEAKGIGISAEEFREFAEIIIREMVEETFAKKHGTNVVSPHTSGKNDRVGF